MKLHILWKRGKKDIHFFAKMPVQGKGKTKYQNFFTQMHIKGKGKTKYVYFCFYF